MTHEKIIKRDNDTQIKIKVELTALEWSTSDVVADWKTEVSTSVVTDQEIHDAKMELMEKLKDTVHNFGLSSPKGY